ncbi:hypothetical protein FRB90_002587 [Tulasnella sp. 427]|nr:hypothetical protein FRB90_002587 [Tulasnella sp. 427]
MKKPAVQYGKKAQRIAARRASSARQRTPDSAKSASQTPADSDDSDSETMEIDEPIVQAPKSHLSTAASPAVSKSPRKVQVAVEIPVYPRRTSPVKAKARLSSSPEPDVMDSEKPPVSPPTRRISAATTLASQLKRKATLEEISSGVESEDPLLLVETPRKRIRAEDSPVGAELSTPGPTRSPTKRTAPRLIPVVEVDTPERLFGSRSPARKRAISESGDDRSKSPKASTTFPPSGDNLLATPTKTKGRTDSSQAQSTKTPPKQRLTSKMLGRPESNSDLASPPQRNNDPSPPQGDGPAARLIFPSIAPTSPRKPGLAKRMLTRTKTDPTLQGPADQAGPSTPSKQSTPPEIARTPSSTLLKKDSLPTLSPQKGSPLKPSASHKRSDSPPSSRPTARTYGKSRSFLVDLSDTLLQDPDSQGSEMRESYQDLRARWGMDQDEEDLEANSQLNDMRTGIELKNKGETRRFMDELGYLFEGLDPKEPLSIRRSSAIEFVEKMADQTFRRKARVADVLDRAWDALIHAGAGKDGDVILRVASLAFAAFVSEDERDISSLGHREGFEDVVRWPLSLGRGMDPFIFLEEDFASDDAKLAGVGKAERRLLRSLERALESAEDEGPSGAILARGLSSQILKCVPTRMLSQDILKDVLGSLVAELNLVAPRLEAYTKSLPLLPPSPRLAPSTRHIGNCLTTLEHCLSGRWEDEARQTIDERVDDLAPGLVAVTVFCELLLCDPDSESGADILQCFIAAVQTLITSCNGPLWSSATLKSPWALSAMLRIAISPLSLSAVKKPEPTSSNPPSSETGLEPAMESVHKNDLPGIGALRVDIMSYALALLLNVLQNEPSASGSVGQREMSIAAYQQQCSAATDESNTQAHFLRGHLAYMLGFLARNESNRIKILSALAGESDGAKLDGLIDMIRDFMSLHTIVAAKMAVLVQRTKEAEEDEPDDEEGPAPENGDEMIVNSITLANSLHSSQRDHEAVNAVLESLVVIRRTVIIP